MSEKPRVWTISIRANPILFAEGLDIGAQTYVFNYRANPGENCAGPDDFAYFIKRSAYDALVKENERLKGVAKDSSDDWKRIQDAERERDRALAMLKRMAEQIDVAVRGLEAKGLGNAALNDALAEYRREFGG